MNCLHVLIASVKEQDPVIPLAAAENQDQPCFYQLNTLSLNVSPLIKVRSMCSFLKVVKDHSKKKKSGFWFTQKHEKQVIKVNESKRTEKSICAAPA